MNFKRMIFAVTSVIFIAITPLTITSCHQKPLSPLEKAYQFSEILKKDMRKSNHYVLINKIGPDDIGPDSQLLFKDINNKNHLALINNQDNPNTKNINFNISNDFYIYGLDNLKPTPSILEWITNLYIDNYWDLITNIIYYKGHTIIKSIKDFDNQVSTSGVNINFTSSINCYTVSSTELPYGEQYQIHKLDSSKLDHHLTLIDKNNQFMNKKTLIKYWVREFSQLNFTHKKTTIN